jgi:hypothetical protein
LTLLTDEEKGEEHDGKEQPKDETEAELVREIKKVYRQHKEELARLQARQKEVSTHFTQAETRRTYKQLMQDAGEAWAEVVSPEEIPLMIDTFAQKVVLTSLSPKFYKMTIHWYDPEWGVDERVCFKGGNPSLHWKEEEDSILMRHYSSATREELLRLLPTRSYQAIKCRASSVGVRRAVIDKGELAYTFCLLDLEIMEQYGLSEEQLRQEEGANLLTWTASSPYSTTQHGQLFSWNECRNNRLARWKLKCGHAGGHKHNRVNNIDIDDLKERAKGQDS